MGSHHITLDTHDPSALLYKLESSNSNLHRSSALRIPQPPSTCIAPILRDNHGLLLPRNSRTLPHHPPVQRQADSSERVKSAVSVWRLHNNSPSGVKPVTTMFRMSRTSLVFWSTRSVSLRTSTSIVMINTVSPSSPSVTLRHPFNPAEIASKRSPIKSPSSSTKSQTPPRSSFSSKSWSVPRPSPWLLRPNSQTSPARS